MKFPGNSGEAAEVPSEVEYDVMQDMQLHLDELGETDTPPAARTLTHREIIFGRRNDISDPNTVIALFGIHESVNNAFKDGSRGSVPSPFDEFSFATLIAAYEASGRSLEVLRSAVMQASKIEDIFRSSDKFYTALGTAIHVIVEKGSTVGDDEAVS